MADNVVPSLTDRGWIRSPAEKADILMSHFYTSQDRQSYIYTGSVVNLQKLVERYGNDPHEMATRLQIAMEKYFGDHFERATVAVTPTDELNDGTRVKYSVRCYLMQGGREYPLEDLVASIDGTFKRIIGFNNDGTPILRNPR